MDLTLGSGWPYGGPQVPISQAAARLRWERVQVPGDRRTACPVPDIGTGEKLHRGVLRRPAPGRS